MKTFSIIKPECGKFENHLWNYISVYAYGLETGARVTNPSFFQWHHYFNLLEKETGGTKLLSAFGRLPLVRDLIQVACGWYGSYIIRAHKKCALLAVNEIVYLPPTVEKGVCDTAYGIGWFFRNPQGLAKYRHEIISAFAPTRTVSKNIDASLSSFMDKRLIGIELRQRPYPGFPDGRFVVSPARMRKIVEEYLQEEHLQPNEVALVIVSDKPVAPAVFEGFTARTTIVNEVITLFSLAKCSVVIGPNSTFSNLAAWFGNVPHIVATSESIDWSYYRGTEEYFDNKYATLAQ